MLELKKYANCLVLAPKKPSIPSLKKIPGAVYSVDVTDTGEIVLTERVKRYNLPEKIYGVSHKRNLRILGNMYEERTAQGLNTGAMVTGFKGSGKTLLVEAVANEMISRERPVFYIDKMLPIDVLFTLAKFAGPSMFLFDEFEKTYSVAGQDDNDVNRTVQEKILTFFSTTEFSGVLSALVSNRELSPFLKCRPQRMLLDLRYGRRTRDQDFHSAMEELGLSPYLRTAMLLGNPDSSRNIDCLLSVASAVEKHYVSDSPDTVEYVTQLLESMNIDLNWPRQVSITMHGLTNSDLIGYRIEIKRVICEYEAGLHITITNTKGNVVYEKHRQVHPVISVSLKGLAFTISQGEKLPFNSDLSDIACELVLNESHMELLSDSENQDPDKLVEEPVKEFSGGYFSSMRSVPTHPPIS